MSKHNNYSWKRRWWCLLNIYLFLFLMALIASVHVKHFTVELKRLSRVFICCWWRLFGIKMMRKLGVSRKIDRRIKRNAYDTLRIIQIKLFEMNSFCIKIYKKSSEVFFSHKMIIFTCQTERKFQNLHDSHISLLIYYRDKNRTCVFFSILIPLYTIYKFNVVYKNAVAAIKEKERSSRTWHTFILILQEYYWLVL